MQWLRRFFKFAAWLIVWLVIAYATIVLLNQLEISLDDIVDWLANNPITIAYFIGFLLFGIILERIDRKRLGASDLAKRPPKELREIARRYGLSISGKAGNTWDRVMFFGVFLYFAMWLPMFVTSHIPMPDLVRWGIAAIVALLLLRRFHRSFIVTVAKLIFIVVTNHIMRSLHVLLTGINFKYPWETWNDGIIVETERERVSQHSDVLTMRAGEIKRTSRFTAQDGPGVTFKDWVLQWGVFPPLAPLNIRFSTASVTNTLQEITESMLNQKVFAHEIEELRDPDVIDEIENALVTRLRGFNDLGEYDKGARDEFGSSMEERNGIVAEISTLGTMKFDDDYEELIRTKRMAQGMREEARELATQLDMDGGQAFDNIMMINKESVNRTIFKVEMDPGTRGAAEKVAEKLGPAVGAAVGAAAAAATGRQGTHGEGGHHSPSHDESHHEGGH